MDNARPTTASGAPRLNVLFVGGYDSTNYAYVELVRELIARGHECTVVVDNERDVVNNKMFMAAGIPMVPLARYSFDELDSVDFVVTGPFLRKQVKKLFAEIYAHRKFVVSFASLFSSVTMWTAPDLLIASGESKFEEFARSGLRYNMIAVGNPQYDPLVRARHSRSRVELDQIRRVLVVDQGAYPLGEVGKDQLAQTLVNLARNNPEMTFDIKARYLPDEDGDHLHSVSDHLYSHLKDVPDNLALIRKPTILEELVLDYDAMITMWSTAHLDAAVLGLPLLLIEGLDSVDVFDVRKQRIADAYEHLRDTGCVVHWKDLQTGPCPFGYVSERYARDELYDIDTPCAPRVVDIFERISSVVLENGETFAERFQLSYPEFMSRIETMATLPIAAEESWLNHVLFREMNSVLQALAFDHRCMGYALDASEMLKYADLVVGSGATEDDERRLVSEARDLGLRLKQRYFASHPDEVARDVFIQDFYFDWLLQTERYDELLAYDGPVVAPVSLEFNRGMAFSKRGHRLKAARHLIESFDLSLRKPIRVLKKDKNIRTLLSRTDQSLRTHGILFMMNHYRKYEALSLVDVPAVRGLDALVYYKMKALVALKRQDDAKALYREYAAAVARKPEMRHRPGLGQALLRRVVAVYGALARGYAKRIR
jgi:hypothetical protein